MLSNNSVQLLYIRPRGKNVSFEEFVEFCRFYPI